LHKGRFLYADILRNEITFEQNICKTSVLAAKDEVNTANAIVPNGKT